MKKNVSLNSQCSQNTNLYKSISLPPVTHPPRANTYIVATIVSIGMFSTVRYLQNHESSCIPNWNIELN